MVISLLSYQSDKACGMRFYQDLGNNIFPVAMRQGETPVPIPNTMVKTLPADDTRLETARESRRLPEYHKKHRFICDP